MQDQGRARSYHRQRRVLGVAGFLLDTSLLAALLFSGASVAMRDAAYRVSTHPAVALLAYLLLLGLIVKLAGLPLDYLSGYNLEHRYELSTLTHRTWARDQLKGFLVGAVLMGVGIEILYGTLRRWPEHWWVISSAIFVLLFIVLANLAPVVLFPIFFKFKPLENSSLIERLSELCRRAGTRVQGVFEWKLSEKTKKANAALVGLGNTRRIILADTLLENFTPAEIETVLAHELGHHVHRHILRGILLQSATTFLGFYLVHQALGRFSTRFDLTGPADFANLPLISLIITALSLLLMPFVNGHSRRLERQADAYAIRSTGDRAAFISGMEKLAERNLAERQPHPLIEFIFSSHPSIEKRVRFAREYSP